MGYAEAIEQQVRLFEFYRRPDGHRAIAVMLGDSPGWANVARDIPLEKGAGILRDALCTNLVCGAPFFVAADICALIGAAAVDLRRMPDLTFEATDLPTAAGYCLFERPLPLPAHEPTGEPRELTALAWNLLVARGDGYALAEQAAEATHLMVFPWVQISPSNAARAAWLASFVQFPLGRLEKPTDRSRFGANVERSWAFLCALMTLCEFTRQRILTTTDRPIANRQARRRATRALGHDPVVRVVELRRRESQQRGESHPETVEWSCRWLVRGHWRNQPYRNGHRPKWITPHIKGPNDRPFKAPRATAYEVVR